jgi:hypothetical protein
MQMPMKMDAKRVNVYLPGETLRDMAYLCRLYGHEHAEVPRSRLIRILVAEAVAKEMKSKGKTNRSAVR